MDDAAGVPVVAEALPLCATCVPAAAGVRVGSIAARRSQPIAPDMSMPTTITVIASGDSEVARRVAGTCVSVPALPRVWTASRALLGVTWTSGIGAGAAIGGSASGAVAREAPDGDGDGDGDESSPRPAVVHA